MFFCCDPFRFCTLGVDPTFNLGDFSVTVAVYRHLLLEDQKSSQSPCTAFGSYGGLLPQAVS